MEGCQRLYYYENKKLASNKQHHFPARAADFLPYLFGEENDEPRAQAHSSTLLIPDRTLHNLRSSRSWDRQILCSSETSYRGFWSSKVVKGSVGWSSREYRLPGIKPMTLSSHRKCSTAWALVLLFCCGYHLTISIRGLKIGQEVPDRPFYSFRALKSIDLR